MATVDSLCDFLNSSPTPSHFISEARRLLLSRGVTELRESDAWSDIPSSFFVVRDNRSLIAIHKTDASLGVITATNLDSPCFLLKPDSSRTTAGVDAVGVSFYGSTTWYHWLDRDLRVAGQVLVRGSDVVARHLVNLPNAIAIIPSLAIHLERTIGLKPVFTPSNFVPIVRLAAGSGQTFILEQVAKELGVAVDSIIDYELAFYDANPVQKVGIDKSMIADCWDSKAGPKLAAGVCHAATMELLGLLQKLLGEKIKSQQSLAVGGSLDEVVTRTLGIPAMRVGLPVGSRLSVREVASIADVESCAEAFYQIYAKFSTQTDPSHRSE